MSLALPGYKAVLSRAWSLQPLVFSLSPQVVVLCFAVAFGSFFQGYGPYPSATKMALPSQHSLQEPYTASVGKTARGNLGRVLFYFPGAGFLSLPKGIFCESSVFKKW